MRRGWEGPIRVGNTVRTKRQVLKALNLLPMEIYCSLSPSPKLARGHCGLIHRTHGVIVTTGKGTTTSRHVRSAPSFERTKMTGGDSITCQRALVGDSLNNK